MKTNVLYFGDNLDILRSREYFPDACVALIYLDYSCCGTALVTA
jgi:hypothetical protein